MELAQRQSAAKSQFLGTVSHELRTPIHGILGAARLVHVESGDPLVKKRMELIEASGTHLLGLVTDLIDVSRVESGQMRIQKIPFDLSAEIERVADIYSLRAADKGLTFTFDGQLQLRTWVSGDPARLRQVLHNLLGNAIKFTGKGWVNLTARYGEQPGEFHFEVRDTGIGIKDEDQKLVFTAFQQVTPKFEGRREGTGLGLTIAHEIAQLLGGGITLKSKPGFGSVFEFWARFELAEEPAHHERAADGAIAGGTEPSARILLVEDNDVNALIAGAMLANQGHQVEHASDGEEAVRRALREIDRPDLVLMDCMMPIMDGFDATRSIRAQEAAMGLEMIPIIALSAIIDEENGRRAIAAGMNDSLGKPFSNDELRAVMRPWLALRESERQGRARRPGPPKDQLTSAEWAEPTRVARSAAVRPKRSSTEACSVDRVLSRLGKAGCFEKSWISGCDVSKMNSYKGWRGSRHVRSAAVTLNASTRWSSRPACRSGTIRPSSKTSLNPSIRYWRTRAWLRAPITIQRTWVAMQNR